MSLETAIRSMITEAIEHDSATDVRARLHDRYMGEPYGDEVKNKSKFVSTDASDAIEAILPDVLEPFVEADEVLAFDPVGPEDEDAAEQETDAVAHIFFEKNDGFLNTYTAMKEGLIGQIAYAESEWIERERVTVEEYEGLTPQEFSAIVQDLANDAVNLEFPELEGLDEAGNPQVVGVDQMGQPQFAPINARIRCVKLVKEYKVNVFPNEEFFLTPRWPSVSLEGVPCCGRQYEMTRGELLEMGFDPASLSEAFDEHADDEGQETSRHVTQDHSDADDTDAGDESSQRITVYKTFCRLDINDDGKGELVRVWAVNRGNTILKWEDGEDAIDEVSGLPFAAFTPFIVPHRHAGRSAVELVEDIAKVKSVLYRHTLDNIYQQNYVRPHIAENEANEFTFDDLMNDEHGAAVRTRGPNGVTYPVPPSVIGTTLPLIDKFDDQLQARIGNTRYNQGMDSNALNKTAQGMGMMMGASQKRNRLISRIFAETFLRQIFMIIHRDLRNGPVKEMVMRLRGQWVQVNPRTWAERTDMTVKVGMGTGDKDMRRQGLMLLAQSMEKLAADPEVRQSGLIGYQQFRSVAEDAMGTFGFRNIDKYMPPPEQAQPAQPDPMAEQMKQMQMQAQMLQMQNAQMQLQLQQAELQKRLIEARMAPQMLQAEMQKDAADMRNDAAEVELKRDKMILDDDFRRDKLAVDAQTAHNRKYAGEFTDTPPMSYGQVG